jgi:sirohydrochlorin ferrochelatase
MVVFKTSHPKARIPQPCAPVRELTRRMGMSPALGGVNLVHPAEAAHRTAQAIAARVPFAAIRTGFIEEPPHLAEVAAGAGAQAICLPLFVARWGHVIDDIPAALARAGFTGILLDPLGTMAEVPALLAEAIRAQG